MQKLELKQDWERFVLLGVILLILLCIGLFVSSLLKNNTKGKTSSEAIPAIPHYLDVNKLPLFDKKAWPEVSGNPMAFIKKGLLPASEKNWIPGKNPERTTAESKNSKTENEKNVESSPVEKTPSGGITEKDDVIPKKPLKTFTLNFFGFYIGMHDTIRGLISIQDSKNENEFSDDTAVGEKIAEYFTVTKITKDFLELNTKDGKKVKILRGEVQRVEIYE
ncbi:MAG: hypothetical protein WCS73_03835 [Lentisphaeria bacterium]